MKGFWRCVLAGMLCVCGGMAQGFLLRHPLHAFPEVQFYNKAHLARLKAKHDELQANMREKREKLQQELDRLEEKRKALKKGKK